MCFLCPVLNFAIYIIDCQCIIKLIWEHAQGQYFYSIHNNNKNKPSGTNLPKTYPCNPRLGFLKCCSLLYFPDIFLVLGSKVQTPVISSCSPHRARVLSSHQQSCADVCMRPGTLSDCLVLGLAYSLSIGQPNNRSTTEFSLSVFGGNPIRGIALGNLGVVHVRRRGFGVRLMQLRGGMKDVIHG